MDVSTDTVAVGAHPPDLPLQRTEAGQWRADAGEERLQIIINSSNALMSTSNLNEFSRFYCKNGTVIVID